MKYGFAPDLVRLSNGTLPVVFVPKDADTWDTEQTGAGMLLVNPDGSYEVHNDNEFLPDDDDLQELKKIGGLVDPATY